MKTSAHAALANGTLFTDEDIYTLIKLPPNAIWAGAGILAQIAEPFTTLIADKDEVTLVMPLAAWEEYGRRLPTAHQAGDYRLITFDIELDLSLVGFMALVARILADAGVPIMAFSAFSRDHLLVPADSFEKAWDALQTTQKNAE